MRQSHAAGEKVFVDFAGDTIDVVDPVTGVVEAMKLFVAALGASNYIYSEARRGEGLADWIGCHAGMFAFFGGVTAMIVCDKRSTSRIRRIDNLSVGIRSPRFQNEGLLTRSDCRSNLHHTLKMGAHDAVKSLPMIL